MRKTKKTRPDGSVDRDHLIMSTKPGPTGVPSAEDRRLALRQRREAFINDPAEHNAIHNMFASMYNAHPTDMLPPSISKMRFQRAGLLDENEDKIKVFEIVLGLNAELDRKTAMLVEYMERLESKYNYLELAVLLDKCRQNYFPRVRPEFKMHLSAAKKLATRMNNEWVTARVHYWQGLLNFNRCKKSRAHSHFVSALPCLSENCYEAGDVQFYVEVTRNGLNLKTIKARTKATKELFRLRLPYDPVLINAINIPDVPTRLITNFDSTSLPQDVQQVDRGSRKILKPRIPRGKKSHTNKTNSGPNVSSTPTSDLSDKARSSTNTLGKVLGETLAEELGCASEIAECSLTDTTIGLADLEISGSRNKTTDSVTFDPVTPTPSSGQDQSSTSELELSKPFFFGSSHATTKTEFRVSKMIIGRAVKSRPGTIFDPLPGEGHVPSEEAIHRDEANERRLVSYELLETERECLENKFESRSRK